MSSLAVLVLAASSVVGQAEAVTVPEKALGELEYLVGSWEVKGRVGDVRYAGKQVVKWAPGKHCLITNWTGALGDTKVKGTAVLGWDAGEEQIIDAGFIDSIGHRVTRWTAVNDEVWEGKMHGFLLGEAVETGVRLVKKGASQFVVIIHATGEMPENEYLFTKIEQERKPKKQ